MRILRLVDDGAFAVEFHPYITVVAGLSVEQRDRIARAFSEAAIGRTSDLRGLIEVHGVVLDLDEHALDLLELDDSEVQTSLFAEDLPGNASSGVDRQVTAAEVRLEALEQPNRDRLGALQAAEAELAEAVQAEDDAREAVEAVADVAVAHAEPVVDVERRAALVERRAALQEERDRRFSLLDPGAGVELADAEDALRAAEAEAVAAVDIEQEDVADVEVEYPESATEESAAVDPPDEEAEPEDVLGQEEREALIEELRTSLTLHRLYDPAPVREALDEVRSAQGSGELVQSTEALSLADRLGDLDRRIAAVDADDADQPSPAELEAANERVERARVTLAERERDAAAQAGTDDLDALEEAHAEVERARDALDGRFGKARAQKRLDDALAAEDEILERLGLHSYADYLSRGGSAGPSIGPSVDVDGARAEVAEAEAEAAALQASVEAALTKARLVEERRHARDDARELLGAPDLADEAITTELLNVRVPADASGPITRLVEVLDSVGLPVAGLDLGEDELEEMVADWLAEYQHTESRLLRRIEALESPDESPIDVGESPLDEPVEEDPPGDVLADVVSADESAQTSSADLSLATAVDVADPDAVARARAVVDAARDRLAAHEQAVVALAETERELSAVEAELEAIDAEAEQRATEESATTDVRADAAATLEAASRKVIEAHSAVEAASAVVDAGQAEYHAAVEELAVLRQTVSEIDTEPPPVGEIEWYLLARLAAQRQQSFVGSLPLVIAGALDGVTDDEGLVHLLDRLERMAGAVQIVHLTDDTRIVEWAEQLDDERAAVVRPVVARADQA